MGMIRWLGEVGFGDVASVGGKAAALGELARAGFRVPGGFVVPVGEASGEEALAAFRALGAPLVAVRSSATAEDGGAASWAGQFETFLNTDEEHLLENIERCRASAWSTRVEAYAEEQGVAAVRVAVIVQAMVPAEVAGVAFSVHPVTGVREPVIEAVRGLGDALVSGRTEPEDDALTAEQAREVAELARRVESFCGYPVDVEWAIACGIVYALQARPITTLTHTPS